MWRTVAVVMCAALPVSFYVLGDLMDAFPGVLTVRSAEEDPGSGPRAVAEDWERVDPADAVGPVGPSPEPIDPADLSGDDTPEIDHLVIDVVEVATHVPARLRVGIEVER